MLEKNYGKNLVAGALLLALAIVFQSIRIFLPIPQIISMFFIGSLINLVLIIVVRLYSPSIAYLIALILPNIAYLQGQLLIPFFILIVAIGNCLYILAIDKLYKRGMLFYSAPFLKAGFMYFLTKIFLAEFPLANELAKIISFSMGLAQIVTGMLGIFFWKMLEPKIKNL